MMPSGTEQLCTSVVIKRRPVETSNHLYTHFAFHEDLRWLTTVVQKKKREKSRIFLKKVMIGIFQVH